MRKKYAYIGLLVVLAVAVIIGALVTPSPVAAQNPYVVGGELEPPSGSSEDYTGLVVAISIIAVTGGVIGVLMQQTSTKE